MARHRGTPGAARDRLKASSAEPMRVAKAVEKKMLARELDKGCKVMKLLSIKSNFFFHPPFY